MCKIAFTCGVMDFCHQGHINLLKKLYKEGLVIVFLHDNKSTFINKKIKCHYNYTQRAKMLMDTGYVYNIIKVDKPDPTPFFKRFLEHKNIADVIYMRGDDWKDAPGLDYLREAGVKIKYVKYTKGISSTKLRKLYA